MIMTTTGNLFLMLWLGNSVFAVPPTSYSPPHNFTALKIAALRHAPPFFSVNTFSFFSPTSSHSCYCFWNLIKYNKISKCLSNYDCSLSRQDFCKQGDVDNIATLWNTFSEKSENAACWGISHQTWFGIIPSHDYKSHTEAINVLALLWKVTFQNQKSAPNRNEANLFLYLMQRTLKNDNKRIFI